jgi:hypothetical protein
MPNLSIEGADEFRNLYCSFMEEIKVRTMQLTPPLPGLSHHSQVSYVPNLHIRNFD